MRRKVKNLSPDDPLLHPDHRRPVTRRDFVRQGLLSGLGMVTGPSLFGLFANPRQAQAALSSDLQALKSSCGIDTLGGGKVPFICFDLAGGGNIAGSNVLTGLQGGQFDFLTTAGYNRLGLPGDMVPPILNPTSGLSDYINTELGLAFHSDSAFLRGILEKVSPGNRANINGVVIPARSENDTSNNPHNPMYAINRCGADGELLTLIGSRSSDSGGNSVAPADQIDPAVRPTKVDRPSDTTGLVDTGKLVGLLDQADAVAVMEAIQRISDLKLDRVNTGITTDDVVKELVRCGYVKSADLVDRYGDPAALDVTADPDIIGPIFSQDEFDGEGEFRKTASIMKLVVNGYAGAGTVTMGGFDYHTGDRSTGELRDLRAGRCMGACIEYAARLGMPLMLYVFSDGSLTSSGAVDNSADGRGKGVWTGDNQSTAASFFLVYNPSGPATLTGGSLDEQLRHQQIGYFTADGAVDNGSSPAANNVNQLVLTVALNYLALHGEQGQFSTLFGNSLGNAAMLDSLTAFNPIM
ncbi:MAG: general secretion pathway protein GspF [Candidatus Thiodiazotropha sp.]